MKKMIWQGSLMVLGLAAFPAASQAHFVLQAPAATLEQNRLGDPQKAAPCGGTYKDFGKPTYAVTEVTGGKPLRIKVLETIYHPGHYRVALAVNSPTELPIDPVAETRVDERGRTVSVSGAVMDPVAPPVLADGLFKHHEKVTEPFETDITMPNINCKACTLQVIQFMENHRGNNPGEFSYHHCATLKITADPSRPLDAGWPLSRE